MRMRDLLLLYYTGQVNLKLVKFRNFQKYKAAQTDVNLTLKMIAIVFRFILYLCTFYQCL